MRLIVGNSSFMRHWYETDAYALSNQNGLADRSIFGIGTKSDLVHLSMDACCEVIARRLWQDGQSSPRSLANLVEKSELARSSVMVHLKHLEGESLVQRVSLDWNALASSRYLLFDAVLESLLLRCAVDWLEARTTPATVDGIHLCRSSAIGAEVLIPRNT
jgi:hypothetical protein